MTLFLYSMLPFFLLCVLSPFSPFAFLYLLPTVYPTHCNSCHVSILSMYPYPPLLLSISLPSLPMPQIRFDSHSLPGLNHQDLLEGPNHRSVSPQRGFCLLTVETNDLHALCLWSVPRHLEAVEVIIVICLTRQATAHSHSLCLSTCRWRSRLLCFSCRRSCCVALNIRELFFFRQWLKGTKPKTGTQTNS